MKIKNLTFLALVGILALTLIACSNDTSANEGHDFPPADMSEYEIEDDHYFYSVTMYEALQLLDDESFNGIIYFGFPACPWCQAVLPAMHEAALETNTDIFYVSRRHDLREGEWLYWDEQMAWWLDEQIEMRWIYLDEDGEEVTEVTDQPHRPNIFVPQIIHLRGGMVVNDHEGTFEGHDMVEEDDDRHLPELTEEEYEALLDTYITIFSGVHMCELGEESCP